jgi:hypothetical protein
MNRRYTNAYVALTNGAWTATAARDRHGIDSPEYRAAEKKMPKLRERYARAAEAAHKPEPNCPFFMCTRCHPEWASA